MMRPMERASLPMRMDLGMRESSEEISRRDQESRSGLMEVDLKVSMWTGRKRDLVCSSGPTGRSTGVSFLRASRTARTATHHPQFGYPLPIATGATAPAGLAASG